MDKITAKADEGRMISESKTSLDALVREGARRMLQEALENEVGNTWLGASWSGPRTAGKRSFAMGICRRGVF